MDARNVPSSMTPLPQERSFSGRISGSRPYFDGPNSAACELSRNTPAASSARLPRASATSAKSIDADFHPFRADGHRALAEAVGEKSAGHGKQDEGQGKERADDQHQPVARSRAGQAHVHDEVNHQEFQGIVVEGALELRDHQAPEAAAVSRRAGPESADFLVLLCGVAANLDFVHKRAPDSRA